MSITIYHNPKCGTSRTTLALIQASGEEPTIVEYLKSPPSRDELRKMIADMGVRPRDLLRRKEALYSELGLDNERFSDEEIITLMLQHPVLIERPIVVTPRGTRLCRPAETVLEVLANPVAAD